MTRDAERYDALRLLLAMLDADDLRDLHGRPRGYRYTCAGDPRRSEQLKTRFARAYIRHRMMDAGREEAVIVSLRRSRLRVVRRAVN